jgi:hypothetical protein
MQSQKMLFTGDTFNPEIYYAGIAKEVIRTRT